MSIADSHDSPPSSVYIAGREIKAGQRVCLHPIARADIFDKLLAEKTARVETIQQDFENRVYLVVTLDDDPGREQWDERILPGHRFFFFPEEVEPLAESMEGTVKHESELEHSLQPKIPVRRILIACIGNIFLGDDSFGVGVSQSLMSRKTKRYPE